MTNSTSTLHRTEQHHHCVVSKHWKSSDGHGSQMTVVFTVYHCLLSIQNDNVYNFYILILGGGANISNGAKIIVGIHQSNIIQHWGF